MWSFGMVRDAFRESMLEIRAFRAAMMLPETEMFDIAEEAARELGESDIHSTTGDTWESVACEMSNMLMDAVRANALIELYRVSIRLYTMQTTLYLDVNSYIRRYVDMGHFYMESLERDHWESDVDEMTYYGRCFARLLRRAPEGKESLAFYVTLLEQALLRWPQRLGEVDLYRGVDLDEDEVDAYRERIGQRVGWAGFASTSLSRGVAERFGSVLFVIHTRNRPYVGDAAVFSREREVLFANRTCAFIVEGVTTDQRTGRGVIELTDFQCFPDYDTPLTLDETRECVARELRHEFGEKEGLALLDGPVGQERIASWMAGTGNYNGELLARVIHLGGVAWRRDRVLREAEERAARTEVERNLRADVRLMFRAVGTQGPGMVARIIASGADLEARDSDGRTPLMITAYSGDRRMVKLLLEAGASARAMRPGTGETALHAAVISGSVKTMRMLLSADVDVDASCRGGLTPLLLSVIGGVLATVALLLNAGADPLRTGCGVLTPLQQACQQGQLEIARLLLRAGADPTVPSASGATALHMAISKGHTAVVRLLLTVVEVEQPGPGELATPL
jgi:hypothetical protein